MGAVIIHHTFELCDKNGRILLGDADCTSDEAFLHREFTKLRRFHPNYVVRLILERKETEYGIEIIGEPEAYYSARVG